MVNATAPAPGVRLRITDTAGRDVAGTRLGERLQLRVELDQSGLFGMFARSLVAVSGAGGDSIQLLDERGCPVDPVIFPGLARSNDTADLVGSFEAFKFSETSVVRFQVRVQFCVDACRPVECGEGGNSWGRRRRGADMEWDPVLGQPVMPGETADLVKEIYVESGTTVDKLRTGAGREAGLVCTRLPVLIAGGVAVVLLQASILTTCLLCLYCSRREKSVGSAESVLSSNSRQPGLAPVYQEQLYRYKQPGLHWMNNMVGSAVINKLYL